MLRTITSTPPLLIAYLMLWGCAAEPARDTTESPAAHPKPVALIDGQAITFRTIADAMSELAGDEALIEHVLDIALSQRCEQAGIVIDQGDIERERELLGETLTSVDQQASTSRVIESLRVRRGLGPDRFERLLRRNAMLRALVGDRAQPDENAVDRALQQAYGPRYRMRLFVSEQPEAASELRAKLTKGDAHGRRWIFADACVDSSVHPSADRGGLIVGLSAASAGYPLGVLQSLQRLEPGECSQVIGTEAGYALIYLENRTPPVTPSESQRKEVTDRLRRDAQRVAMQRLAQQLLSEHEVIVLDQSLNWAWLNRP